MLNKAAQSNTQGTGKIKTPLPHNNSIVQNEQQFSTVVNKDIPMVLNHIESTPDKVVYDKGEMRAIVTKFGISFIGC